ncbi:hypothetical protein I3842_08G006400 [Carya illinoinensis]|uniref:Uncharacterized protein n=1 Tax=Carya illinoinensis TaxID=32201 RepID=A0A922E7A4_CARIL|nr:hypothetical protein I3842_08G006400 [Carya illinoinensis]
MIFFLAFWDFQLQEPITMIIEGWMDREQIISMSRFCMIHGIEKFHPKESYFFNHDLALVLESFIRLFLEEFISSYIYVYYCQMPRLQNGMFDY